MFEKSEIEMLKKELPAHFVRAVVKKTGLSYATINRFFNFHQVRRDNAESIYDACLELVIEQKERAASRKKKIQKLMIGDAEQQSLQL